MSSDPKIFDCHIARVSRRTWPCCPSTTPAGPSECITTWSMTILSSAASVVWPAPTPAWISVGELVC